MIVINCPNCGSEYITRAASTDFKCKDCGKKFDMEQLGAEDTTELDD